MASENETSPLMGNKGQKSEGSYVFHGYPLTPIMASLLTAVVAGVIGVWGGNLMTNAQYVLMGTDWSAWTTSGYEQYELEGIILQSFLVPFAALCLWYFGYHYYKSNVVPLWMKFAMFAGATVIFIALLVLNAQLYPIDDILDCAVFFCIFTHRAEPTAVNGVLDVYALLYVVVCSIFVVIFSTLATRTGWELLKKQREDILKNTEDIESTERTKDRVPATDEIVTKLELAPKYYSKKKDVTLLLLAFVIFYPLIIVLCMALPDSYQFFTTFHIQDYARVPVSDECGKVFNFVVGPELTFKLYPDILFFYLFIYIVAVAGFVTHLSSSVQRAMHSRPEWLKGMCTGELLLILLFSLLLIGEFTYWYTDHLWECETGYSVANKLARTMGQLANCVTGLLVLPIARNNIWSVTFGVSWEYMVKFHRWLGRTMLVIIILHILFWVKSEGWGIMDFPYNNMNTDDWTVPLTVVSTIFMLILIGLGTLDWVRRNHFEVFYYAHHFFLVVFVVMLWHAISCWYYIVAGLSLWLLDRGIRLAQGLSATHVVGVKAYGDVTEVRYLIENSGKGPLGGKKTRLQHKMGQYCFINIPSISMTEWHPYTISSAPSDSVTKHNIKSMGPGSFGDRLNKLAQTLPWNTSLEGFTVNVDGPYGVQPDFYKYEHVVFIVGGIGVTPAISCFRELYLQTINDGESAAKDALKKVELVWGTRSGNQYMMFEDTLSQVSKNDGFGKFSWKIHVADGEPEEPMYGAEAAKFIIDGRPDLKMEVEKLKDLKPGAGLVFACGPPGMMKCIEKLTMEYDVDFHAETFIL